MKKSIALLIIALQFLGCAVPLVERDPDFIVGTGFDGAVISIVIQADNKIIAGGAFTHYLNQPAPHIIRLNPDGSIDPSFSTGSGFSQIVTAVALDAEERVLVGTSSATYNGTPVKKVVRLSSTGILDTDFGGNIPDFTGNIKCFALQGTKILVGGQFKFSSGPLNGWNGIARLNDTGVPDMTFTPGSGLGIVGNSFTMSVNSIIVHPANKIIVGGSFNRCNGTVLNAIAGLNENGVILTNSNFNAGTGFLIGSGQSAINSMVLQPDGKIIVAGPFSEYLGYSRKHIARIFDNGNIDAQFNPDASVVINAGTISQLALQPNGKVLVVGGFSLAGFPNIMMIRIHCDGRLDEDFDLGSPGFSGAISTIALMNDGKIIVGGSFGNFQGQFVGRIAKLMGETPTGLSGLCIVAAPSATSYCANSTIQLMATGGSSYLWSNGATTSIITVSPTTTTTYSVNIMTTNGCVSVCSKTLTVEPAPPCNLTVNPPIICPGSVATISAPAGGTNYEWSVQPQDNPPVFTINSDGKSIQVTRSGPYMVKITYSNGCVIECSADVKVSPKCNIIPQPVDLHIEVGQTITLNALAGVPGVTYLWSSGATTSAITVQPSETTTYTLTVTDASTCSNTCSKTVVVTSPACSISRLPSSNITSGQNVSLNVIDVSNDATFIWSTGQTTRNISVHPSVTTSYTVTVTEPYNSTPFSCSSTVTVNP